MPPFYGKIGTMPEPSEERDKAQASNHALNRMSFILSTACLNLTRERVLVCFIHSAA